MLAKRRLPILESAFWWFHPLLIFLLIAFLIVLNGEGRHNWGAANILFNGELVEAG
jgi:hypothetical protein